MGTNDMDDGQASSIFGSAVIALPWLQSGKIYKSNNNLKETE